MKTTFKILAAIFGLGTVILLGLHLFLQHGLTKTLREVVLPRIEAENGIAVQVGRLSINLPNGLLYLDDVVVKNPDGFFLENLASIERVRLEVDLFSLLKQRPIRIINVRVENALLNVVRNREGEINLNQLQTARAPEKPLPSLETPRSEKPAVPSKPIPAPEPVAAKPLPKVLVEALYCRAKIRYVDFKLDELDVALDLGITGSQLSTQNDSSLPWGDLALVGSLGNQQTRFVTDLRVRLAPLADPQAPSFDLAGTVLEIDPRMMAEAYSRLGIRSAPFGLEPQIHCRGGGFVDSAVVLNLTDIVLEEKLAERLGGMASIDSLRFPVPIEGSVQQPTVNMQAALSAAIGGNAQTLLASFLGGVLSQEAPPEDLTDAAVDVLATKVDEIAESETLQAILKEIANGAASDTNATGSVSSDALIDILGEHVEEVGDNEELKNELKSLGKWLFGQ